MKQTFLRNSQPLSSVKTFPFVFDKAKSVSSSQRQITDRHTEPQEHSSYRHNKSDLRVIIVTEGENSSKTRVNNDTIKLIYINGVSINPF
jgi:hypothetical protein